MGDPDRDTPKREHVISLLDACKEVEAKWALVGAHAVGMLTEPRATTDFDFVIQGTKLARIIRLLEERIGDLGAQDIGSGVRLLSIDIDLIRSNNHPLFREAITRTRMIERWSVPVTEVLLALKFMSAVSPWRGATQKAQDFVDLRKVYENHRDALDRELLSRLADLVYRDAHTELEYLLDRIDRGDPISI